MAEPPSLLATAQALQEQLASLITHLQTDSDITSDESNNTLHALKRPLLHLTESLQYALKGPSDIIIPMALAPYETSALSVFVKYKFHLDLPCTAAQLAEKHGLDVEFVERTLALLRSRFIVYNESESESQAPLWKAGYNCQPLFIEPVYEFMAYSTCDTPMVPGHILEYLEKYPKGREKSGEHVLWMLNGGKDLWQLCAERPELAARVLKGMQGFGTTDETAGKIADWIKSSIANEVFAGKDNLKVIDLGGGNGNASIKIATALNSHADGFGRKIGFEIQDLHEDTFKQALNELTPQGQQISGQLSFRKHNFFESQPSTTQPEQTVAFFLRRILHDWTDHDSITILRHLLPVLEKNPQAAILINESVLPEKDELYPHEERGVRRLDYAMMLQLNSKERTLEQWKNLLAAVDDRLKIEEVLLESDQKKGGLLLMVLIVKLIPH